MIEVEIVGVRIELPSNQPLVLLKEIHGERHVPIWIGTPEASAIALAQQGVVPPRPMTHDLLVDVVEALGHTIVSVNIVAVEDNIFYGQLQFENGTTVSSGPRMPWRLPCAPSAGSGAPTPSWTRPASGSPNTTRARTRTPDPPWTRKANAPLPRVPRRRRT